MRDGWSPTVRACFDRDVLSLPGITHAVFIKGINPIRHDGKPANVGRIGRLHLRGIKIIGGA